jgi:lipoprotein-releasing system ATP-binding protein
MTDFLSASGITRSYRMGPATLQALKGVGLTLRAGEMAAVVGPSGSGKSTLLHILGLLEKPDAGTIRMAGRDLLGLPAAERARLRNAEIGFVFQFYHLLPELTALENVTLPAMMGAGFGGWRAARREATERATDLLGRIGLGERLNHRPAQLSGGERQRVAIARALANRPKLLLCDEPTGNLDRKTAAGIVELLLRINREDRTAILLVTHDHAVAARCERIHHLVDGKLED